MSPKNTSPTPNLFSSNSASPAAAAILLKRGEWLKQFTRDRLKNIELEKRIQSHLDKLSSPASSVVLSEVEQKLKIEANRLRQDFLVQAGVRLTSKADDVKYAFDDLIGTLEHALDKSKLEDVDAAFEKRESSSKEKDVEKPLVVIDSPKTKNLKKAITKLSVIKPDLEKECGAAVKSYGVFRSASVMDDAAFLNFIVRGGVPLDPVKAANMDKRINEILKRDALSATELKKGISPFFLTMMRVKTDVATLLSGKGELDSGTLASAKGEVASNRMMEKLQECESLFNEMNGIPF